MSTHRIDSSEQISKPVQRLDNVWIANQGLLQVLKCFKSICDFSLQLSSMATTDYREPEPPPPPKIGLEDPLPNEGVGMLVPLPKF